MYPNADEIPCYSLSESAITFEFGHEISDDVLVRISACNELLSRSPFPGFKTAVPAYTTLTVFYDPTITAAAHIAGKDCFEKVSGYVSRLIKQYKKKDLNTADITTIPVCYGGAWGPDLEDVAVLHKISVDEIVRLHSEVVYKVYMIGFLPGFAYLGGMNARLTTPRKAAPRNRVPAGSVGIAGQQTGIYPLQSPGGWQIIGRTPISLFNFKNSEPALLKAGDMVQFKPISPAEFKKMAG